MSNPSDLTSSRREFLKTSGQIGAVSALAGVALPHVHAAEDSTLSVALVGCGGRGSGAVVDALSNKSGPIRITAMADVYKDKLDNSYRALKRGPVANRVEVAVDKQFLGFDGYKHAMD
ncbi:MAG: twin-arginine translocation signal domain-containing protein, partial [Limisphaerales bacterium]